MAKVAIYCSSSNEISDFLVSAGEELARDLVQAGYSIVYGGTTDGLMGKVAQAALDAGGYVEGVISKDLIDMETPHEKISQLHWVENITLRKQKMIDLADYHIVCPGGIGTLDEAFGVLVEHQIGTLMDPVIFYNVFDVWSGLLQVIDELHQQKFIRGSLKELFQAFDESTKVIEFLNKQKTEGANC